MKHGYKEFAIIGAGRFGSSMAETLYDLGCEVLIIDKDEELVEMVSSHVTHAIRADVTENGVLEQLGLHNFDVVVVAIGQDMQASVLITMMLKELGVPYIIAKSQSDIHGRILQRIGADKVVYPERDMGSKMAYTLVTDSFVESIELSDTYSMVEIRVLNEWIGKDLIELNLRGRLGLNIIAIRDDQGEMDVTPNPKRVLAKGDILFVVGPNDSVKAVTK